VVGEYIAIGGDVLQRAHIRPAGLSDLPQLAHLFDLYRQFYKKNSSLDGAAQFLRARIANKESVIFVAEAPPDELSGFVQLYPSFTSLGMGRSWILNDLYVSQAFRRQGVGRALMEAAHEFAKSTGALSITLETQIENTEAQALYEALGYSAATGFAFYSKPLPSN
jgi:ribosomal protein S18 acetylase RimI-like enzyme